MISQAAIANNTVTIFSKTYCPYCRRAKSLFASEFPDVKTEILEYVANVYLLCNSSHIPHRLDDRDDGSEIQDYLQEKTGQRSVPNIFISTCKPSHTNLTRRSCPLDQKHVGGCDTVVSLNSQGKLAGLVSA